MVRTAARGRTARPGCGDHHRHRESRRVERAVARYRDSDQGRSGSRACPRRRRSVTLRPAHRSLQNPAPRGAAAARRRRPHCPDPDHHLPARREARNARRAGTRAYRRVRVGMDEGVARATRRLTAANADRTASAAARHAGCPDARAHRCSDRPHCVSDYAAPIRPTEFPSAQNPPRLRSFASPSIPTLTAHGCTRAGGRVALSTDPTCRTCSPDQGSIFDSTCVGASPLR